MRIDFTDEMQRALELHPDAPARQPRRITLVSTDMTRHGHGRVRGMTAYYGGRGHWHFFTDPDEIERFDRLHQSLVGSVRTVTMRVKGPLAELIPTVVILESHAAGLELHDPSEPRAFATSFIRQRWFGLGSALLTVVGRGPDVDCFLTAHASRKPQPQPA